MKLSKEMKEAVRQNYAIAVSALHANTDALLQQFDEIVEPKKYILKAIEEYEANITTLEESYLHWIYIFRKMADDPNETVRAYFDIHKETIQQEIDYYRKEIRKLQFRLSDKKPIGDIGSEEIERAKAVPLGELLPFNSAGFVQCIFHKENHGSMKWYKKSNRFTCFGCQKSGDAIDIVMALEGLDFISAVKLLVQR